MSDATRPPLGVPAVGVLLMPTDPWPVAVETATRLEEWGFDHLWVYDHLSWQRYRDRPWHAPYPWLAALAARTARIGLGTMVANPNIRHPYVLAKDAMTIDHVSEGRFVLGIGAGGVGFDATALGQEPLDARRRMDRLEEYVGVVDALLRGELEDHRGEFFQIEGARMLPGCVCSPRLPLALAAGGPRALRLVAEAADAWITLGDVADDRPADSVALIARHGAIIDAHCAEIGRDPETIRRMVLLGHCELEALGSIEAFRDVVGRLTAVGVTDVVFHHPRDDDPIWSAPAGIVEEIAASRPG